MKKFNTLRRLIREAVLFEMGWEGENDDMLAARQIHSRHDREVPGPDSDYHIVIKDWLKGKNVPNKVIDTALGTWFTRARGRPAVVLMKWTGGPVVMGYPIPAAERVPGGDLFERESFELDQLANMFGLDPHGPKHG